MISLEKSDIFRVLVSLIHAGLKKSRCSSDDILPTASYTDKTPITVGGLEADSIELLSLAGAVSRMFCLHESGIEDYLLRYKTLGDWVEIVHQGMSREKIVFSTSGSTGSPKFCTHSWQNIEREIVGHARIFANSRRIVAAVAAHHIYGFLFTAALPRYMNLPVCDYCSSQQKLMPGDLIVSFPVYWQYLNDTISHFPENCCGVTSTSPCKPDLIRSLISKGLCRMTEIYGSSETGGVGFRHDHPQPYQLFSYLKKDAICLMDEMIWEDDTHFYPVRRKDGAVQIGGVNVFPDAVAQKISTHPSVKECGIRLIGSENDSRLKAFIVLSDGISYSPETRRAISEWLYTHLSAPERPVSLTFGAAIPRNDMGKEQDWEI